MLRRRSRLLGAGVTSWREALSPFQTSHQARTEANAARRGVPGAAHRGSAFHATHALFIKTAVGALTPYHSGLFDVLPGEVKDEQIRDVFRESVKARTIGNNVVRKYIRGVPSSHWQRATEALEGAKEAGLKPDADTMGAYLNLLLRSGQLRLALETYNAMLADRICPHTKSFNQLIELCLEKKAPEAALSLFDEMQTRGRHPDVETYELLMKAYAMQSPPQWEKAVVVFDKIQRSKVELSAHTYNAIMTVYLNMDPFDWRVVYNAYYEMRCHKPRIHFGWETYHLVAEALRRGNARRWLRFVTYLDAWIQITPFFSAQYWAGAFVFVSFMTFLRLSMLQVARVVNKAGENPDPSSNGGPLALR